MFAIKFRNFLKMYFKINTSVRVDKFLLGKYYLEKLFKNK